MPQMSWHSLFLTALIWGNHATAQPYVALIQSQKDAGTDLPRLQLASAQPGVVDFLWNIHATFASLQTQTVSFPARTAPNFSRTPFSILSRRYASKFASYEGRDNTNQAIDGKKGNTHHADLSRRYASKFASMRAETTPTRQSTERKETHAMRIFSFGLLSLTVLSIAVFIATVFVHPTVRLLADGVIPVH